MARAERPNVSISSSGLPLRGISPTARRVTVSPAGATARAKSDAFARDMYYQPDDFAVAERVQEVAKKHGRKPTQIALAWVGSRSGVTAPIIGATRMEHLDDAVAALAVTLDDADVTALEELYRPHAVLGHQ